MLFVVHFYAPTQVHHLLRPAEWLYFRREIKPVILNNIRNIKAVDSIPYYSSPVALSA